MPKAVRSVKEKVEVTTGPEQTNHHSTQEIFKYADGLRRASNGFVEAASALDDGERSDGSIDKRTKVYSFQCAIASLEDLSALARSYARTPEYLACIRGDENFEYPIIQGAEFRSWALDCAEALEKGPRPLGCTGERIAKTIRRWLGTPDAASTLELQCDASARLLKLEASR